MFTIHRIIFFRFACPPIRIILSNKYFYKKKFYGTNALYLQLLEMQKSFTIIISM